ncbi:MAG: hypothetical protein JXB33_03640 [Clostridia bacterium]|nr:hypothetical protein [Clostridia bacterium]
MKRNLAAALMALGLCITFSGCGVEKDNSQQAEALFNTGGIIEAIYSALPEDGGDGYSPGSVSDLRIDSIIPGSYTGAGKDEFLAVLLADSDQLSHAAGLYHAYMAVFDNSLGIPAGEILHLRADEGDYGVFRGKDRDRVFFTGAVVFQGSASRDGGLYVMREGTWEKAWPEDGSFWESHAVDIRSTGLRVLKKNVLPGEGGLIPEITWDFEYFLGWVKESDSFIRQDFEY